MTPEQKLPRDRHVDWGASIPFLFMHVSLIAVFWVGFSWVAAALAVLFYVVRMFAITGFYHRYFAHKTFKTSRWFQLVMAVAGASAVQKGPIWWASHHRHHHAHSDDEHDVHSPAQLGFWWSHMGWVMTTESNDPPARLVKDLRRYPELTFIDKYHMIVPVLFGAFVLGLGVLIERFLPSWGSTAGQVFVWGFLVSTIVLYHGTYTINSLSHQFGRQRFETGDDSRNNFWLALLTLGEGWHNNHHYYPGSARQGFYWWEIDIAYYGLKLLSWCGLIRELNPVPARVKALGLSGGRAHVEDPPPSRP